MLLRGNQAGRECGELAATGAGCNWTANVRTNQIARATAVLWDNLFRDGTRSVLILLSFTASPDVKTPLRSFRLKIFRTPERKLTVCATSFAH